MALLITRGLGPETGVPVPGTGDYGGSGGMGGDVVYHTEYREKPLPIVRIRDLSDDEDLINKEIWIRDIKDFDSL